MINASLKPIFPHILSSHIPPSLLQDTWLPLKPVWAHTKKMYTLWFVEFSAHIQYVYESTWSVFSSYTICIWVAQRVFCSYTNCTRVNWCVFPLCTKTQGKRKTLSAESNKISYEESHFARLWAFRFVFVKRRFRFSKEGQRRFLRFHALLFDSGQSLLIFRELSQACRLSLTNKRVAHSARFLLHSARRLGFFRRWRLRRLCHRFLRLPETRKSRFCRLWRCRQE